MDIRYFGVALLDLFFIFMISRGKNWARLLFFAGLVLALLFGRDFGLLGVLSLAGAVLLLTPEARDWFKLGL